MFNCLLPIYSLLTCHKVVKFQPSERLLPQWLTGIIALVGFLFLTFVVFLMKKAWCDESGRSSHELFTCLCRKKSSAEAVTEENSYETSLDLVRYEHQITSCFNS
uniref:Uncharacterized protein n=1 Tax=Labrus bergylta TaxID=56723 RepID=A0A3Q3FH55_9LABR